MEVTIAHQREKLMDMAARCEEDDDEESADDFRHLANMLPGLVHELGVPRPSAASTSRQRRARDTSCGRPILPEIFSGRISV